MARKAVFLAPGEGRGYPMGRMHAIFKADSEETAGASSISEWWLDANTEGPPVHHHAEDHVFYIIVGAMHLFVHGDWLEAPQGSYALIPGGTPHTFDNRGAERAGLISFNTPGGFEEQAKPIQRWFEKTPLGDAQGRAS